MLNTEKFSPAVVAWFVKASVFHSVNSAPSANGGSNPAWECYNYVMEQCIFSFGIKEQLTGMLQNVNEVKQRAHSHCTNV